MKIKGTPHSPNLQDYWDHTIKLFIVISWTVLVVVLPLCRFRTLLKKQGWAHKWCTAMDPTYGRAKAGRPARTYIQQLFEDTGCSPKDLPEAINDREKWLERVKGIRASGTRWWWWWWYIHVYWYVYWYVCARTHTHIHTHTHSHTYIYICIYIYIDSINKVCYVLKSAQLHW